MKTRITQGRSNLTERHGQPVITPNKEIIIPENDPVRLRSAQLAELEYGELYEAYSSIGRKWTAGPKVMFEVLVHGYLCGTSSSRQLEEAYRLQDAQAGEEEAGADGLERRICQRQGQA